ncbi:hypothetical protein GCM10023229_28620 [Flavisolibacter ginsenosidimutans]
MKLIEKTTHDPEDADLKMIAAMDAHFGKWKDCDGAEKNLDNPFCNPENLWSKFVLLRRQTR